MKIKSNRIMSILPFLEEEELDELVDKIVRSEDGEYEGINMTVLMPFLDSEQADRVFIKMVQIKRGYQSCAPFVSEEALDKAVDMYIAKEIDIDIVPLAPFMDDESIGKLLLAVSKDPSYSVSLDALLPFADSDDLDASFVNYARQGKDIKKWLPFVSDDAIHELVDAYVKDEISNIDIDAMYQFLDDDDIRKVFRYHMSHSDDQADDEEE
ncbi:MAG TPA: hypothetical protein PKC96_06615 [Bacilli bacterium]|nr:hypothetical protein [Bacilli bacterium]